MQTYFDWITVLIFIFVVGTFFLRLRGEDPPLALYVGLSIGCAIANWLGNEGFVLPAFAMIAAIIAGWIYLGLSDRRPGRP